MTRAQIRNERRLLKQIQDWEKRTGNLEKRYWLMVAQNRQMADEREKNCVEIATNLRRRGKPSVTTESKIAPVRNAGRRYR